jgi:sterol desaturase/sphingolipid hydroxylase (fatty acid hydroxylase superfamily)
MNPFLHENHANIVLGFFLLAAIFIPLERLFALHPEQKIARAGWKTDIVHFFVNHFAVKAGLFLVLMLAVAVLRGMVDGPLQKAIASQPGGVQFLEAVLVADVAGYTAHRLTHRVPWLWRFHAVHHSVEEMDWLASSHLHPVDQIFTKVMTLLPLYLLGFSRASFGVYLALITLQPIFIHSNVRFRFGWLRYLFATPEFHHWHHSAEAEAWDKNFAPQFPLLDYLFGTLHLPRDGRMPDRYGIDTVMDSDANAGKAIVRAISDGYIAQMVRPFKKPYEE